jgi:group I intron endonuclease
MNKVYHGFSHSSGVYKITNKDNGLVYFGQATQLGTRAQQHESKLLKNKHHNRHLQHAWNKYGPDAFEFEVIAVYPDKTERDAAEQALIDEHYGPGCYNIATDATLSGMSGRKHKQETKDKIAAAHIGKKHGPHSQEHKDKAADKHRGRKHSPEWCAAISAAKKGKPSWHKGVKRSAETCAILVAAWVKRREAKALLIDNKMKDLAQ